MKKLLLAFSASCVMFGISCTKTSVDDLAQVEESAPTNLRRTCAAEDVLKEQMAADPALAARMQNIESFTRNYIKEHPNAANSLVNGNIVIPVVVNVVYRLAAENISDAQVQSQIDVLNNDFGATNADYNNTPAAFQQVRSGAFGVQFVLNKIVRFKTKKNKFLE